MSQNYLLEVENFSKHFYCFYYTNFYAGPKSVRVNSTHCFMMKISNKWKLQKIAYKHSSDIDFEDFSKNINTNHDSLGSN